MISVARPDPEDPSEPRVLLLESTGAWPSRLSSPEQTKQSPADLVGVPRTTLTAYAYKTQASKFRGKFRGRGRPRSSRRSWRRLAISATASLVDSVLEAMIEKRAHRPFARISVRGLTDLAALLAGRKRPTLRDEWRAHLAGESGHDPITWQKVKEALGFVASAIRCRCSDVADAAWTPVDAILKSRKLSNLMVFGPTTMAALFILRHAETLGVLTSAESISAIGFGLYGLVRVGRWWRDVKPPEPKARRTKE